MKPTTIVAVYLIVQALGTVVWWGMLLSTPQSMGWFQPAGWTTQSLLGFLLPDLVLLVAGSTITSFAVWTEKSWSTLAIWMLVAAVWYPTLYCIGVSFMTDQAWIASATMATMAGLTLATATIHGARDQSPAMIRVTPMKKATAIAWTLFQITLFWSICLWILPNGMVEFERRVGWNGFESAGQTTIPILIFAFASMVGIWSAMTMATQGKGTPLPTATAPALVVSGPYRFVRNPMAVAGILQGLAIGWYWGSYGVVAYSLAGALLWHLCVRRIEEADLLDRFGDGYVEYCDAVRLWLPTFHARRRK